jgi:hypothetical protein
MALSKTLAVVLLAGFVFAAEAGADTPATSSNTSSPLMQTNYATTQANTAAAPVTAQPAAENSSASERADLSPLAMLLLGLAALGIGLLRNNKYSD